MTPWQRLYVAKVASGIQQINSASLLALNAQDQNSAPPGVGPRPSARAWIQQRQLKFHDLAGFFLPIGGGKKTLCDGSLHLFLSYNEAMLLLDCCAINRVIRALNIAKFSHVFIIRDLLIERLIELDQMPVMCEEYVNTCWITNKRAG